jgi:hypothetical protein
MVCDEDENIIVLLNINTLAHQDIMTDLIWLNKLGKYGCIKSDGKTSLAFDYDFINTNYTNGLISKKDKCGMIKLIMVVQHEIVTCEYDNIIVIMSL